MYSFRTWSTPENEQIIFFGVFEDGIPFRLAKHVTHNTPGKLNLRKDVWDFDPPKTKQEAEFFFERKLAELQPFYEERNPAEFHTVRKK